MSVTINQANYGSAVYGTARYGLFFVTINNGVSATGAIEAPSVGGFEVDVTEVLNSVSATGSVGTITASGTATVAISTTTVGSDITSRLISVAAQNNSTWTQRTANISSYIGNTARLVILYQSGTSFTGDVQFDDFNVGGNTFTDFSSSQGFQTNNASDNSKVVSGLLDNLQTEYNGVTFQAVGTSTTSYGKFVRDGGGTPSSGTGNTSGNTGSFYLYAETSSNGSNNDFWLRSPEVTINNGTLSFYSAQNGATCGPFYAYLDITSTSVQLAVNVGTLQLNVSEVLNSVSATGSIGSLGVGIDTTLSGVSATGAVGTVEDKPTEILTGVSATGGIGTFTISNTVGSDGVVGTTNTPAVQPNVTEIIATGVTATVAVGEVTVLAGDVSVIISGVSATGAIQPVTLNVFEVDVTEILVGVEAIGAIGTTVEHTTALLPSVSATASVGTTQENIIEKLPTQVITGSAGSIVVGVTPTIVGVSATSSVGIIEARTLEVLASVSATGAIGSVTTTTSAGLEGVGATGEVGTLALSFDKVIDSVNATGTIGTLQVNVKKLLASVSATLDEGTVTATGVAFDFEAVKELYDRNRTVYVEGFTQAASERTVYVQREVRLVYIERFSTSAERRARASKAA